jgi:hypothetical protein
MSDESRGDLEKVEAIESAPWVVEQAFLLAREQGE